MRLQHVSEPFRVQKTTQPFHLGQQGGNVGAGVGDELCILSSHCCTEFRKGESRRHIFLMWSIDVVFALAVLPTEPRARRGLVASLPNRLQFSVGHFLPLLSPPRRATPVLSR